jgi:molybdenum cofactor cytidylyltransferase
MRLEAVVLAAGLGARFGGRKLTSPWREGVLLDAALAAASASPVRGVSVVWGADPGVPEAATAFAHRTGDGARLRVVFSPRHNEGLSASLAAGIAALPSDTEGAFVFLGDMPRIPPGLTARMAEALARGAAAVAPMYEGRQGHPVLFGAGLFPRLLTLSGDRGAASVLRELGPALAVTASADDGVLFDVDRAQDLD